MDFDDLMGAAELLNKPTPVAYLLSRAGEIYFKKHGLHPPFSKMGSVTSLLSTPVYSFSDVPEDEVVVFFNHDALRRYAALREAIGHNAAMLRLRPYIQAELIQQSTVRALLEVS